MFELNWSDGCVRVRIRFVPRDRRHWPPHIYPAERSREYGQFTTVHFRDPDGIAMVAGPVVYYPTAHRGVA